MEEVYRNVVSIEEAIRLQESSSIKLARENLCLVSSSYTPFTGLLREVDSRLASCPHSLRSHYQGEKSCTWKTTLGSCITSIGKWSGLWIISCCVRQRWRNPERIKLEESENPEEVAGANIEKEQANQQDGEAQPPNPVGIGQFGSERLIEGQFGSWTEFGKKIRTWGKIYKFNNHWQSNIRERI